MISMRLSDINLRMKEKKDGGMWESFYKKKMGGSGGYTLTLMLCFHSFIFFLSIW
jgi:hypothetical protein